MQPSRLRTASVCVIGAGPAGLTATKSLKQAGHQVTCFEQSSIVGGHWAINNPNGHSSAYDSLTTNTTKKMSRFSDYEIPADWPELPSHEQMQTWFASYATHFNLETCIHLDHRVISAVPVQPKGWEVTVEHKGSAHSHRFDALVAASGNYWQPKLPELPGKFSGEILHAQLYRNPDTPLNTKDKRVIVVGIGNTGCELALEISKSGAAEVLISARSGAWIMPKYTQTSKGKALTATRSRMSHPEDPVPPLLKRLPEKIRGWVFEQMAARGIKKAYGAEAEKLHQLGLPQPPDHPLDKRATVADDLPGALQSGRIKARGAIASVSGREVVFASGETDEADIILCATGYGLSFPYLTSDVLPVQNSDIRLFRELMHPTRHDLFVVGIIRPSGGFWPVAEAQSRFIGKLLSGEYRLPGQRGIDRFTKNVMGSRAFNPALYGLALSEELARGAKR